MRTQRTIRSAVRDRIWSACVDQTGSVSRRNRREIVRTQMHTGVYPQRQQGANNEINSASAERESPEHRVRLKQVMNVCRPLETPCCREAHLQAGVRTYPRRSFPQVMSNYSRLRLSVSDIFCAIEGQRVPLPISDTTKESVYTKCAAALSNANMSEDLCCVCDRLTLRSMLVNKALSRGEKFQQAMHERLHPPDNLPERLKEDYSAAHFHQSLRDILLSPRGVFKCSRGKIWLRICKPCHGSLSNTRNTSPPKFAIANGLFFGKIPPQFEDTTPTENAMLSLGQPTHFISAVRGGMHTSIRSHAYVFRARPQTPASMVPVDVLQLGTFKVRMVGAMTSRQKIVTMKRYQVRSTRLQNQLHWYVENNYRYQNPQLRVDEELLLRETCVVTDQTMQDVNERSNSATTRACADALDDATHRFNSPEPAHTLPASNPAGEDDEQLSISVVTDFPRASENEDIRADYAIQTLLSTVRQTFCRSTILRSGRYRSPSFSRMGGADWTRHGVFQLDSKSL
jgi:hypothetical protein